MIDIFQAVADEDLRQVRTLLIEYQADIGVDLCFQQFDAELAGLPGSYAPPRGRLLLAMHATRIVGCVAMQPVSDLRCEMKRLYVRAHARHLGIGRQLVLRTLEEARQIGYQDIVLDTLPSMTRAQMLYERLGFLDIPPYRANPVPGARYLGRRLA